MTLTDAQRLWKWLNEAGAAGVHSHDIRKAGYSGNPSQRAKDIVSKGQRVFTSREGRNGRPGSRYWLDGWQPDWAVPVKGNHENDVQGGGVGNSSPKSGRTVPLSAEPNVIHWHFNADTKKLEDIAA